MMAGTDTIAAIATAVGKSGIGIVRISGEEAFSVLRRIFRKNKGGEWSEKDSYRAHYGYLYDGEELIDEVLVLVMRGPHSYTAEDTVEIDCHGGVLMVRRILETVLKYGARPAEPGEFTKRAFLNGRIDLSQAEAVMDAINAETEYARKNSISQLKGKLSKRVRRLREAILYEMAFIESALDDPEHISLEGYPEKLEDRLDDMIKEVKELLDSSDRGRVLTEGVKTVIVGKPNAGKSSLMNLLAGEERAIVTEIAGTTRDTLQEHIQLKGISLNLIDTAGIRDTEDIVEQIGVSRARRALEEADLILYVADASVPLDENDAQIIRLIQGKKAVVVLNKTDLEAVVEKGTLEDQTGLRVIRASVKEETGMEELEEAIKSMFYDGEVDGNDPLYLTNLRHKRALTESCDSLMMVKNSIKEGLPEDFYSIDLMDAYEKLGSITGESVEDDLVNEIFRKFCTGK